jgi:Putative peptidoglycan binding domain
VGVRTYPTPEAIRGGLLGPNPTMDQIDQLVCSGLGSEVERQWASNVWTKHITQQIDSVMGDRGGSRLPLGVVSSIENTDIVVGLADQNAVWRGSEWSIGALADDEELFRLTTDEVAFAIDSLTAGAKGLVLMDYLPMAWLDRELPIKAAADVPPNGKVVAIVDEFDPNAVLDCVLITPGPVVKKRHNGEWVVDRGYLAKLTSVKPPKLVVLQPEQIDGVVSQVDASTEGDEFKEFNVLKADGLNERADDMALSFGLLGAIKGGPMPAKLQKYWLAGPGAAKIRWGTPGAWRRCYRNLVKYLGPIKTPGACTNLSEKLGGHGVATHVRGSVGMVAAGLADLAKPRKPPPPKPKKPVHKEQRLGASQKEIDAAEIAYNKAEDKYYKDLNAYNQEMYQRKKDEATLRKALAENRKKEAAKRKKIAADKKKVADAVRLAKKIAAAKKAATKKSSGGGGGGGSRKSGGGGGGGGGGSRSRGGGGGGGGGGGRSSGGGGGSDSGEVNLSKQQMKDADYRPLKNGGGAWYDEESGKLLGYSEHEDSQIYKTKKQMENGGSGGSGGGGGGSSKGKGKGGGGGGGGGDDEYDPDEWYQAPDGSMHKKDTGDGGGGKKGKGKKRIRPSRAQPGWDESLYERDENGMFTFKGQGGEKKDGLSKGDGGESVENVQDSLKRAGYDVGETGVDGKLGDKTEAAIKQFQKDNGLAEDGIAGNKTLTALDKKAKLKK